MKHMKHISKTFQTYICNMRFQRNISLLLGMEARRHVEFIGVELASGAEFAAPVEKATAAGGAVEREEDELSCSCMEDMPTGRAEAW
jgi:hypothetical protein